MKRARKTRNLWISLLLLAAMSGSMAGAQTIELEGLEECSVLTGRATVRISGAPAGAHIDWNDGNSEPVTGDGTYTHTYALPGSYYSPRLYDGGDVIAAVSQPWVFYSHVLMPSHSTLAVGEELTVTISAFPDDGFLTGTGVIDWDDGSAPTPAGGEGAYTHTYTEAGIPTIRLGAGPGSGCHLAHAQVNVGTLDPVVLTVETQSPRIDESVSVIIDNEPPGGTLDWGTGFPVVDLTGAGWYELAGGYSAAGDYQLEVFLRNGSSAGSAAVSVVSPILNISPSEVEISEAVTAEVFDGPEGGQLDWGDGSVETGLTGAGHFTHEYSSSGTYLVALMRANFEVIDSYPVTVNPEIVDPAATISVEDTASCPVAGLSVLAHVTWAPVGASIDWRDSTVVGIGAGDGSYPHTYTQWGEYRPQLLDAAGGVIAESDWSLTHYEHDLAVSSAALALGEELTVTVSALPDANHIGDTGEIHWGDGTITEAKDSGTYTHRYDVPGNYMIELTAEHFTGHCLYATAQVQVAAPVLAVNPSSVRIDEPVSATISAEPVGGSLDWGNGSLPVPLDGSGSYELSGGYPASGAYTLELLDALGSSQDSLVISVASPDLTVQPASVGIGEPVTAAISSGPESGELDWGDGNTETGLTGENTLTHAYASSGSYQVTLRRANGVVLISRPVGVDAATFTVAPDRVNTGETVTAHVGGEPASGSISWDDGETTSLDGSGSYGHAYSSAGSYLVALLDASGAELTTYPVTVTEPQLLVSPGSARIGEPVTADVTVAGPATLAWGDGNTSALSGLSGPALLTHRYQSSGDYTVELLTGGTTPAAGATLEVLAPQLDLSSSDPAAIGETVTISVANAPLEAELDWGDGQREAVTGDGDYHHRYSAGGNYDIRLLDTWQNNTVTQLSLNVTEVKESISITGIRYLTNEALIEVTVALEDLAPGQNYTLDGTEAHAILQDVSPAETVQLTFHREGEYLLVLQSQPAGEVRASQAVELAWPRAAESIRIVNDFPHLTGDFIEFQLSGLDPDYGYTFQTDATSGFERRIEGEESWTETGIYATAGIFEPALLAHYPGESGPPELRDSVLLEVLARTGAVEIEDGRIPYGLETVFKLNNLVPGARYRLDYGDRETEEFVPFSETETLTHTYTRLPNLILLESFVQGGDIWELLDTLVPPAGWDYTGELTLEQGGTVAGNDQTFVATGLKPGAQYRIHVMQGSVTGAAQSVLASAFATADDSGQARIEITFPRDSAAGEHEEFIELTTQLYLWNGTGASASTAGPELIPAMEFQVDTLPIVLAPLQRTLGQFVVEVTELLEPLTAEKHNWPEFSAAGVVRDLVLAGKLQGDVAFTFRNLFQADVSEPLPLSLPARFDGMELSFSELILSNSDRAGYPSSFAGSGRFAGKEFRFTSTGYHEAIFVRTGELIIPATYSGEIALGDSGWVLSSETGNFLIDLAANAQQPLEALGDPSRLAITEAYAGWELTGRAPAIDPGSDRWTGVLFLPDRNTVMRDPRRYGRATSDDFLDAPVNVPVVWTSSGFSLLHGGNPSLNPLPEWNPKVLSTYMMAMVDSQVVVETPLQLQVQLPLFEKPYLLNIKPGNDAGRNLKLHSTIPVATSFGMSAVIADQPRLEVRADGTTSLVFNRAVWTLDQSMAKSGTSLDTTLATQIREDAATPDLPPEVQAAYENTLTALNTAENLLRLQLPLDGLTIRADGSVSLSGAEWQTLASTPEMDMYGFPYMTGGSAEIGIKKAGDEYAFGLRGALTLGGIVRANAAPAWYHVRDGHEVRLVFEGVTAALGDPNGLIPLPASFNLTIGGLVSLAEGDNSLELNGAGELTIGISSGNSGSGGSSGGGGSGGGKQLLNIQVAGVFGINDSTANMSPYWYVYAGTDLGKMGQPVVVTVEGVDIFAFYVFKGGIGHHLRLAQRSGVDADEPCAVDDEHAAGGDDKRPSLIRNALECFDDSVELALLAETVIGWYPQSTSGIAQLYGLVWHMDAMLTTNLSTSGDLVLAGRGWAFKNLDQGYRAGAIPNMMARLSINSQAVTGSFCLGPAEQKRGELDCSGLEEVRYVSPGGLKLVEASATAELRASWTTHEYFFAIGRQAEPVSIYIFPNWTSGYFVAGYVRTPGVISGRIPASGIWAAMYRGMGFDWGISQDFLLCSVDAYARANFSFGGEIGVRFTPSYQFNAGMSAGASASAGLKGCSLDASISVSMSASGQISGPSPFQFSGSVRVTADLPLIKKVDVTINNVVANL